MPVISQNRDMRELFTYTVRKNTVCVDLKEAMPNLTTKDWVMFLKNDLKIGPPEVKDTCLHSMMQVLMVALKDEETFSTVLERLQEGVMWGAVKKKVYGWSVSEELTTVKLINIAGEIPSEFVKRKMEEFGQVISFTRGHLREWPTVTDGSMVFRMKIHPGKVLPSNIIYGEYVDIWPVFCRESQKICYKCSGRGHIAAFCRKAAKLPDLSSRSWAKVASGPELPPAAPAAAVSPPAAPVSFVLPPAAPAAAESPPAAPVGFVSPPAALGAAAASFAAVLDVAEVSILPELQIDLEVSDLLERGVVPRVEGSPSTGGGTARQLTPLPPASAPGAGPAPMKKQKCRSRGEGSPSIGEGPASQLTPPTPTSTASVPVSGEVEEVEEMEESMDVTTQECPLGQGDAGSWTQLSLGSTPQEKGVVLEGEGSPSSGDGTACQLTPPPPTPPVPHVLAPEAPSYRPGEKGRKFSGGSSPETKRKKDRSPSSSK